MQKSCIYFLIILLVIKQTNCQQICLFGEIQENGECKECEPPFPIISSDNKRCVDQCENEFIETKHGFKRCVKECPEEVSEDNKNCLKKYCPTIKDITQKRATCLNSFSECTTGVISKDKSKCQKKCPSHQLAINETNYKQCVDCDYLGTHQNVKVNGILQCKKKCEDNKIYGFNGTNCIKRSECTGFVNLDTNTCNEACEYYIRNVYNDGNPYKECLHHCDSFQYSKDGKQYCASQCPEQTVINNEPQKCNLEQYFCPKKITKVEGRDLYQCVPECQKGDFLKQYYRNFECINECIGFEFQLRSLKFCTEKCPRGTFTDKEKNKCYSNKDECEFGISSDQSTCVASCKKGEFIQFPIDGKFQCLSECDDGYQFTQNQKLYCTYECPQNMIKDKLKYRCHANKNDCDFAVSADGKECIQSCKEFKKEFIENKKCVVCTAYYEPQEQTCQETCSPSQIIDNKRKLCHNNKEDCFGYISFNGKQCIKKCNSQNRETKVSFDNYIQCEVCDDYFTDGKNKRFSTCTIECDDDQITIIPLKTCTKDLSDCQNYLISSDGKSCDSECNPPDILKQGKCIFSD